MAGIHPSKINMKIPSGTLDSRRFLCICLFAAVSFYTAFSQEYFQQEVKYTISVTLRDTSHELDAFEKIVYINHSPDTLHFIYFHLWPNAWSDNNTALARQVFQVNGPSKLFNDPELKGYIDALDFQVNGSQVQWNLLTDRPDICRIELNQPLEAGDTMHITTPFHVKIPSGATSRLGHIGESYQISQWYPKPAVYDRDGWHPMSYLDRGEFYSEFGSFDVRITLPSNYIVGATGNLHSQQEIEMLDALAADTSWTDASHIGKVPFPASTKQVKTLHYTANAVHDFAWFADKRFNVMKGHVSLPGSGREVTTWVMFTNRQSNLWKEALNYVNDAILWASMKTGDYPYQHFTAVQSDRSAGYGMEYPGIAVIGIAKDAYTLDVVLTHEIFHNWFYAALASNERKYPFMDEGITSAYTTRYLNQKYPYKKLWQVYLKNWELARFLDIDQLPVERMRELEWLIQARSNLEQPVNLPATEYSEINYGISLYNKADLAFNYLREFLGDSLFDAAMREYYQSWMFMHPQPNDLQQEFEKKPGKNLDWFFNDLIGTNQRLDYQMVRIKQRQVLIKNKGELVAPLIVAGMNGDSVFFEKWVDGFAGQQWIELPDGNYTEISIDPWHVMPEIHRMNNNIRKTGTFPRTDPIHTQLLFTLDDPEKHTLMYLPLINWTRENGFMAGLAVYNGMIIPKHAEFVVIPFYAFGNNDLAGFGKITYKITPYDTFIRLAEIYLEGIRFGAPGNQNYRKVTTGADLFFRNQDMRSPLSHQLSGEYIFASNLYQVELQEQAKMNFFIHYGYRLERRSTIHPFTLQAGYESGRSHQKTTVEFNYRLGYYGRKNGLDLRFFAGTMLKEDPKFPFYSFAPGGRSGRELYLFQETFPDRFAVFPTNLWSRQMSLSEGALVTPVNEHLGYSRWLVSLSLTSSLPGKISRLPLKPFVNLLINDQRAGSNNAPPIFYEAGIKTGLWNILEIYVPLLVSNNIASVGGPFKNRIRFVFSLGSFDTKRLVSR
ncbi:MAG: M1 family metallopeptidase [Bacteroidales bacterium]|nr:M1 family metallopeptidase [Bacteroidales bacterium]MDT8430089.1 M1 family metallopeptidase [Bacteroidales bacterium]